MAEINRDNEQEKAADLWVASSRKNTLLLGTGFGKCRTSILIIQKLLALGHLTEESNILLLVDSDQGRNTTWREEFDEWGCSDLWAMVTPECYQTAYKWKGTSWDLTILDEVDFALTEKYSLSITNNSHSMLLGLTGYVDSDKRDMLDAIAPPLMEYTTQDAQDDGILNKTQVTFIQFDLSQNKSDIVVTYKKGKKDMTFTQSENDAYEYAENQCNMLWGKILRLRESDGVIMGVDFTAMQELDRLKYNYGRAIAKRKELLLNSIASAATARDLIALLLQNDKNKIVTFSMLTDQADKINDITYHGKNKKVNFDVLDKLSLGSIRSVGVCKAINRGKNIKGLNSLIMESFDGSSTQFTQRHGRGTRLEADRVMNLYILVPYYYRKTKSPDAGTDYARIHKPTQAVKWINSMMKDYKLENPIIIRKGKGSNDWTRDTTKT